MDNQTLSDAAFMGKITAGVTHELKNVLAIIKESAGLMEDLIGFTKEEIPHRDKFLKSLNKIAEQVRRGVDISTELNGFAHASDEETAEIHINVVLTRLITLGKRTWNMKGVNLSLESSEPVSPILSQPMTVHNLLFEILAHIADKAGSGSRLLLTTSSREDVIHIDVRVHESSAGTSAIVGPDLMSLIKAAADHKLEIRTTLG
jgi:C4-dicarboxylate-specific signal transduction histidine kinase